MFRGATFSWMVRLCDAAIFCLFCSPFDDMIFPRAIIDLEPVVNLGVHWTTNVMICCCSSHT